MQEQEEDCSAIVPTFWKLQAKLTHSALPSSLIMKHGAYSKTHKQKHKMQSGETQTHLPQRNPLPTHFFFFFLKLTVFFDCRGKEFVPNGQTVNQDVYIGVLQHSCNSILYCHPEL